MFEMKIRGKRLFHVAVFLLLGALLPVIFVQLFSGDIALVMFEPLYVVYIIAYVLHIWLYGKLLAPDERRWWRWGLLLLWLYMAVAGLFMLWVIMA